MHVEIKSLSPAIRSALDGVRYGAADIQVIAADSVDAYSGGNDGQRGFVVAVNLDTGERKAMVGSWGGSSPFSSSPVDVGSERVSLPINGVVIKGQMGYPRTFATIYCHPNATGHFLPSGEAADALTAEEDQAIYCFAAIKGGEYRRDEMRRRGVTDATVDGLVDRGYLKRNKAGATQITTKGKNARTVTR